MKIFDLELRKPHEQTDLGPSQPPASYGSEDAETSAADARVAADGRPEIVAPPISLRPDREQAFTQNIKPIAIDPADRSSLQAPAFLKRSSNSKLQTNAPKVSRREELVNAIVARLERARSFWQRHLVRDVPSTTAARRSHRDQRENVCAPDPARCDDLRRRIGRPYSDQKPANRNRLAQTRIASLERTTGKI